MYKLKTIGDIYMQEARLNKEELKTRVCTFKGKHRGS